MHVFLLRIFLRICLNLKNDLLCVHACVSVSYETTNCSCLQRDSWVSLVTFTRDSHQRQDAMKV